MSTEASSAASSRPDNNARLPASFKPGRGQAAVFRAQANGVCTSCQRPIVAGYDFVAIKERPRGGLSLQTKPVYVHALPCAEAVGIKIPAAAVEAGIPAAGTAPDARPKEELRTRTPRGEFRVQQRPGELRTIVAQRASSCPACTGPIQAATDIICLWRTPAPEISPHGKEVWIHARCAFERGLRVPAGVKSYIGNQEAVADGATYRSGKKSTYRRGAGPGALGGPKY